jgi:hypothetical protein
MLTPTDFFLAVNWKWRDFAFTLIVIFFYSEYLVFKSIDNGMYLL